MKNLLDEEGVLEYEQEHKRSTSPAKAEEEGGGCLMSSSRSEIMLFNLLGPESDFSHQKQPGKNSPGSDA